MEKKKEEEPDLEKDLIINKKYQIQYKLGKGGFGKVYLVQNLQDGKNYAMKVLLQKRSSKHDIEGFKKEKYLLKSLYNINSSYILKFYEDGEFIAEDKLIRLYFIMDYAEKGDLLHYIKISHGFGDKSYFSRFIFKKILEGIHFCHCCNITHLDIKPANILLDNEFNPIIHDFGLSLKIVFRGETEPKKLRGEIGTRDMKCPQMFEKDKEYYGVDADIFELGVLLFKLVVGKPGFKCANHDSYKDIKYKKYDNFWTGFIDADEYSKEFKNLFVRMVVYDPEERPRIKYILEEDPWLKELNILIKEKPEEYKKLEEEYITFMNELEHKMISVNQSKITIPKKEEEKEKSNIKSISNNKEEQYFTNLTPKKIKDIRNYKYFIKIERNLELNDFMNSLIEEIKKFYDLECYIKTYSDELKLKFDITFVNNDEDKEDNRKDCIMKIKLLISGEDEYLFVLRKIMRIGRIL